MGSAAEGGDGGHQGVEHRLMAQVQEQGHPAAPAEKADGSRLGIDPGQQGLLLPVGRPAQDCAQEEPAQVGQQGEIVRRGKAGGRQAQGEEPDCLHLEGPEPVAQHHQDQAQDGHDAGGQPPEQRPEEHTKAQQMQHAEADHDAAAVQSQPDHGLGDQGHGHGAAEDDQAPAETPAAQGDADAREHHEDHAAVLHDKLKYRAVIAQAEAQEIPKDLCGKFTSS